MINIDSLPKSIEYNGNLYFLDLHITSWNKICVSYQYAFSPKEALEKGIEYIILSQVVEPNMKCEIKYSEDIDGIVDVPNTEMAFNILSTRINSALSKGFVELYK